MYRVLVKTDGTPVLVKSNYGGSQTIARAISEFKQDAANQLKGARKFINRALNAYSVRKKALDGIANIPRRATQARRRDDYDDELWHLQDLDDDCYYDEDDDWDDDYGW